MIRKGYTLRVTKGYTLVELLVGISIVAVIFGVGFISYREFSRRQSLTGITKQLVGDLRLAQQLALTGQKPEVCTKLIGYTFTATSSNYKIIASCSGGTVETKTVDISADTTISAGSVTFKVLGQGTSLTSPLTFTITNSSSGVSGTVTIGIGGDIQ
jgi:prepilin-type N-terminal cleavage/methylation domain-containing protein